MAHRWRKDAPRGELPSKQEVLDFIAEQPGNAGKREIARAFGVTGGARIALKRMLRELKDEGLIDGDRKRLILAGELPRVLVVEIVDRDADGELVAIPAAWESEDEADPPKILLIHRNRRRSEKAAGVGDRALVRVVKNDTDDPIDYSGSVIKVLESKPSGAIGIFRALSGGGGRIVPVDRKQRELSVEPGRENGAEDGDLVRLAVRKSRRHGRDEAEIREVVGSMKSEKAVSAIAIHSHDIPHAFSDAIIAEARKIRRAQLKGREDWRDRPLITIDPTDAKDHDDAVMAEPDPNPKNKGGWIATVAIADVSWYVRPGSVLDKEALKRGNSVYFPDRVVPMLPERLSNDLCSLREGEDRPALAARMAFSKSGRKISHSFHRVMMRSPARLSYVEAQAAIDGSTSEQTAPTLKSVLEPLWACYRCLMKGRADREPLDLDLPERKIILKDDGTVDRIHVPDRLDAHKLIEEFMIQANVAAAETLEERKLPFVYRVHDQPSLDKLEALREFLRSVNVKLPQTGGLRPSHFNTILAGAKGTDHQEITNEVILRSQSQAEYNPENIGHFGLNLRRYAHFTSPIRRYADLVVHRALVTALGLGAGGLPKDAIDAMEGIATQTSTTERRAMAAERDTTDRLIALWLADRVGALFKGRISGVTKAGLFVRLDNSGADGFVPASTIGREYYIYDQIHHAMVGEDSGETFRLGDRVTVKLVEAEPYAGSLRFEVVSDGRKGKPPRAARRKQKYRPDRRGSRGRSRNRR